MKEMGTPGKKKNPNFVTVQKDGKKRKITNSKV